MALLVLTSAIYIELLIKKTQLPDCQGMSQFPSLMEFGCIGTGGVENNKDRPYECSVNECEQESACWCEYLVRLSIYNLIASISVFFS